jgi:hypothetical protein
VGACDIFAVTPCFDGLIFRRASAEICDVESKEAFCFGQRENQPELRGVLELRNPVGATMLRRSARKGEGT